MWKLFYIYSDVVKFLRRVIYKLRFVRFPYQPMHIQSDLIKCMYKFKFVLYTQKKVHGFNIFILLNN